MPLAFGKIGRERRRVFRGVFSVSVVLFPVSAFESATFAYETGDLDFGGFIFDVEIPAFISAWCFDLMPGIGIWRGLDQRDGWHGGNHVEVAGKCNDGVTGRANVSQNRVCHVV